MGQPSAVGSGRGALTAGLLLCVGAIAFEFMAVLAAMPAAVADLGQPEVYAWAFTGFVIAQTFAIVAAGQLADRVGPVLPMISGAAVFAVGLVCAALAPAMGWLVLARFVQGLGAGAMNVCLMILVGRAYEPRAQAQVMTGFSIAWMAPTLVGPVLAAWLAETWSWRWVFWSVLPLLVVANLLVLVPLRRLQLEPPQPPSQGLGRPMLMAALIAAGAALLQWAGQHLEPLSLVWLVAGLALLVWGLPTLMPVGYRPWAGGLSAVVTVRTLLSGAFYGAEAFLPLMLVSLVGLDLQTAAFGVMVGSAGWTIGGWLQSRPWLRIRRDTIIVIGTLLTAAGMVSVAIGGFVPATPLWLVLAGWALAGGGMGLAHTSTSLAVMQLSAPDGLGRNTSSLQVGEALGNALLGGLAGTIFAVSIARPEVAFGLVMAAMTGLGLVAALSATRIGPLPNHSSSPAGTGAADSRPVE